MPARLPTSDPQETPLPGTGATTGDDVLPPRVTAALQALARSHRATFFMVVLTGFALALARVSGAVVVSVGVPCLGQRRAGWDSAIGMSVSSLPMVFHFTPASTFTSVLADAREQTIEAMTAMDTSFEEIMTGDDLFHPEMFHAALAYTDGPRPETTLDLDGTVCTPVDVGHEAPKFIPVLGANLVDDQLRTWLTFDAATYRHTEARALLDTVQAELTTAAKDASERARLPCYHQGTC